jgi:hypothetical protein
VVPETLPLPGTAKLHVLDLKPETVKLPNGKSFTHGAYRIKPTSTCFYSDDLYMLRFGQSITDTVERTFFGAVDRRGSAAVEEFSTITGFSEGFAQAQGDIPPYMGAQNSGPSGSLLLSRRTLTFPASCRFIPAHCIGDFAETDNDGTASFPLLTPEIAFAAWLTSRADSP